MMFRDPDNPVLQAGAPLEQARAAMILLHGRGGTAEDILGLSSSFQLPDVTYIAPQAAGRVWYPNSFMTPIEGNEPWLSNALSQVAGLLEVLQSSGLPPSQVVLSGFSQGACLALEYAARSPQRYGGVAGLSGGLIGQVVEPGRYQGSLQRTPVFIGCSTQDPFIPEERVRATEVVYRQLEADIEVQLYPGLGHTINRAELDTIEKMLLRLTEQSTA